MRGGLIAFRPPGSVFGDFASPPPSPRRVLLPRFCLHCTFSGGEGGRVEGEPGWATSLLFVAKESAERGEGRKGKERKKKKSEGGRKKEREGGGGGGEEEGGGETEQQLGNRERAREQQQQPAPPQEGEEGEEKKSRGEQSRAEERWRWQEKAGRELALLDAGFSDSG